MFKLTSAGPTQDEVMAPPTLPNELLIQIVDTLLCSKSSPSEAALNRQTAASLCRTSKALQQAVEAYLYGTVCLSLPARANSFVETVLERPERLRHVKYIWFGRKVWYEGYGSQGSESLQQHAHARRSASPSAPRKRGQTPPRGSSRRDHQDVNDDAVLGLLGLKSNSSLPLDNFPLLEEAAWITNDELVGGFLVGHSYSTRPEGRWCSPPERSRRASDGNKHDNSIQVNLAAFQRLSTSPSLREGPLYGSPPKLQIYDYHLMAPTLTGTFHRLFARMPTIVELKITLYPGAVLDDDELEYVLRRILSPTVLPLLQRLTINIAHDRLAIGSRIRRIDRSRTVISCCERIADSRLDVQSAGREFGTTLAEVADDIIAYGREDWEARVRKRQDTEACAPSLSHDSDQST